MATTTLKNIIKSVSLLNEVSKRTNTPYSQICILFKDGYEYKKFLTNEEKYIVNSLLSSNSVPSNNISETDLELGDFEV